mgnify:CR=1 FL=1
MCEKAWSKWHRSDFSESACADPEKEHSAPDTGAEWCDSSEGKPSDEKIVASLAQAREELGRLRKTLEPCDNIVSLALANVAALERRCAALEKESREAARSPEKDYSVAQKISELRESLEDSCPQGDKSSSPKGEEHFLVAPIRGIDEDGRLILGDRRILSASALKI